MAVVPYEAPEYQKEAFNCPHCGAFAHQLWWEVRYMVGNRIEPLPDVAIVFCNRCGKYALWYQRDMIIPYGGSAPLPNPDMPGEIKDDYEEARSVLEASPRGAAALLRLCIQKLCKHLGEKGRNINDDIGSLVKKGLPVEIQQALDAVRVIGNDAVHPGQLDLKDDTETASALFDLVNLIVDRTISQQRQVQEMYAKLPTSIKKAIEERDARPA